MRLLSAEDVRAALPVRDAIDAMRTAFIALSDGRATVPVRASMPTPEGMMLYMPAYIDHAPINTVKVVSVFPNNRARNLPVVTATVLVIDAETGAPLALIEGKALTAIRTGAGSGLATDLLARRDARILGVIGAGVQARTQIEAVCTVRDIQQIRVYSPHRAALLVAELRLKYPYIDIHAAASAHQAAAGADVLVTATSSKTPVLSAADVAPGTHVNGIGSFTPQMQEIAADLVMQARVVVDHRASVWEEAGDLIIPRDAGLIGEDHIYAEVGEIAAGKLPGRTDDSQVTFFKSVGNAVQDAAAAAVVLAAADAHGLGQMIAF